MLIPKRVKRRMQHSTGHIRGSAHKGNTIAYGDYALVSDSNGRIKSNQIEAARIAMTRFIKRGGKVWTSIFPHTPVTKHPAEARMGSGKGNVEYWVAVVKKGRVLFEMSGVPVDVAREAMRLAGHKLPVKTKFMVKEEQEAEKVTEGGEN